MKLVSTEQSLQMEEDRPMPSNVSGLENFALGDKPEEEKPVDADSLFNLPKGDATE